jgi:hypothetical protein
LHFQVHKKKDFSAESILSLVEGPRNDKFSHSLAVGEASLARELLM